nr:hypothetical protein [Tanacetum cinerariifolium]
MVSDPLAPTFVPVFFRNLLALMIIIDICHFRSISSKSSASICFVGGYVCSTPLTFLFGRGESPFTITSQRAKSVIRNYCSILIFQSSNSPGLSSRSFAAPTIYVDTDSMLSQTNSSEVFKIKDALGNKQYKPDDIPELFRELLNDVQNIHEELAEYINSPSWNRPVFYNNDDNDGEDCTIAITPDFLFTDSLNMGDEHLDTIPATESDKFIKSSVENHVLILSESEDECEFDVPDCNDSQTKKFSTFSNPLFDDSTSSDDESSHEEDIHEMSFQTYSNPLFDLDEEIISSEFNSIHNEDLELTLKNDRFDTEPYLLESLPNHDTLMSSPLKIDSLLAEFADIHLVERLLYDNSSPRPPKEIVFDNSNDDIESFSPSPIPNKDSDSHMEEIDLPFSPDDPMPLGIKDDDYDFGRDISILEELLDNYSFSLPDNESYHFDIPSPYRPHAKPPDGKTGTLNIKMMGDVSDQKVHIPGLTITRILNQEKSPDLLPHQGL